MIQVLFDKNDCIPNVGIEQNFETQLDFDNWLDVSPFIKNPEIVNGQLNFNWSDNPNNSIAIIKIV